MPVVRLTVFFQSDDGWGWSETHHKDGGAQINNLGQFLNDFSAIVQNNRRPLLGRDQYIYAARASYPTVTGEIASAVLRYNPPLRGTTQNQNTDVFGCAPGLAAKLRMGNLGGTKFSDVYLRGFWDAVEQDEELKFNTALGAAWKALADQFTAALIAGQYGWLGIDEPNTRRGKITNYVWDDATEKVVFTVTVDSGPALPAVGTKLPIRVARLNNSKSPLNTTHVVTVTAANTLTTVIPTAAGTFTAAGTWVGASKAFIAYNAAQYYSLARRKSGRPFTISPGRLRDRARN